MGLRFECTGCSRCCRHEPGYVFLSENDLSRLCAGTGLSRAAFIEKYCRSVNIHNFSRLSLKEKENCDCIFWKDGGCTIYEYRPLQCRTYPFWEPFLQSREDWESVAGECPGVNRGRLYSRNEIDAFLEARRSEKLLGGDDT